MLVCLLVLNCLSCFNLFSHFGVYYPKSKNVYDVSVVVSSLKQAMIAIAKKMQCNKRPSTIYDAW